MRAGLKLAIAGAVAAVLVASSAMLAAPGQQGSERPGQIVPGEIFIGNRPGMNQAVPIVLEAVTSRTPIPVAVAGTAVVSLPPTAVVAVRQAFQAWEYRSVNVPAAQDPSAAVATLGSQGWELAGIVPAPSSSLLVLKRPR
jgi:hypothetical protein